MTKVLITGGCGYIGSHTAIELLARGSFEVISIDNFSNASPDALQRIETITGRTMQNYAVDLCDASAVHAVFEAHPDIKGVIHFAAYKAVGESVEKPLDYYHNNFLSLINILQACQTYGVRDIIFSSSCSLYGNIKTLPVREETPLSEAESPYAYTKLAGERILRDTAIAYPAMRIVSLRYFNPVGAHESGLNGEAPIGKPSNLVPVITQTAAGIIPKMKVFGGDYDTRDGTCVRDYIHVSDLAEAHILGLEYLMAGRNEQNYEIYNIGSGAGVTVLEAINAFESVAGLALNYEIAPPRAGDVVAIYSDSSLAKEKLGWEPKRDIENMMRTAWKWQQNLNAARATA